MTFYNLPETDAVIEYDKDAKSLYIALDRQVLDDFKALTAAERGRQGFHVARTVTYCHEPLINADFDSEGNMLGIEVLLP